ncbi:MAG: LysR family transcriptional regulator [Vicingaceae bacterium]
MEENNSTFLADGRIELLKIIEETESLSKAAKAMNMSYRKAWELIQSINQSANQPMVETKTGGPKGGFTCLTEYGKKTIDKYEELSNNLNKLVLKEFKKFSF